MVTVVGIVVPLPPPPGIWVPSGEKVTRLRGRGRAGEDEEEGGEREKMKKKGGGGGRR